MPNDIYKISELEESVDVENIYTIGSHTDGQGNKTSKKVSLALLQEKLFERGADENSIIQKDGNNRAISEGAIALGSNNLAGLKGYYWNYINLTDKTIYLSKENTELLDVEPAVDTTFENPYSVGDIYSMRSLTQFYDCGTITAINHNKITVDKIPEGAVEEDDRNRYYFYILLKPETGIADFGTSAFVEGYNNKSLNYSSHAEGCENISYGRYSHTEGSQNKAAYAAHAEGYQNNASGYYSHSEGYLTKATAKDSHAEGYKSEATEYHAHAEGNGTKATNIAAHSEGTTTNATNDSAHAEGKSATASGTAAHAEGQNTVAGGMIAHAEGLRSKATGDASHAEGRDTVANGARSHVEGDGTVTNNANEHAEGRYNKSNKITTTIGNAGNTQHSIGIGTSGTDRKNAFEIMQNGDAYVLGVGGYDGTNAGAVGIKTLQDTISTSNPQIITITDDMISYDEGLDCYVVTTPNHRDGTVYWLPLDLGIEDYPYKITDINKDIRFVGDGKYILTTGFSTEEGGIGIGTGEIKADYRSHAVFDDERTNPYRYTHNQERALFFEIQTMGAVEADNTGCLFLSGIGAY